MVKVARSSEEFNIGPGDTSMGALPESRVPPGAPAKAVPAGARSEAIAAKRIRLMTLRKSPCPLLTVVTDRF
jgi:hypothetical protein